MSVFYFLSTPLSLNMWTYFSISAFTWGQARSKLGGVDTSILHLAFKLIFIALWGYYYTLYHNTYAISLLLYKVYMKRENAGSWNSGLEKEQILETYSLHNPKSPETSWSLFLEYIKNIGRRKYQRGATATSWGCVGYPWRGKGDAAQ